MPHHLLKIFFPEENLNHKPQNRENNQDQKNSDLRIASIKALIESEMLPRLLYSSTVH